MATQLTTQKLLSLSSLDSSTLASIEGVAQYLIDNYHIDDAISKFAIANPSMLYDSELFQNYHFNLLELKDKNVFEILDILMCSFLHSISNTIKLVAIQKKVAFELCPNTDDLFKAILVSYKNAYEELEDKQLSFLYKFCAAHCNSNEVHILVNEDDNEFEVVYINPELLTELEEVIGLPLSISINLFEIINN